MSKFESLARRLVLLWGLSLGCGEGTSSPSPTTTDPPAVYSTESPAIEIVAAQLKTDLGRLHRLQIVSVETLAANGAESHGCYGLHPCDDNLSYPVTAAVYRREAPRLNRLVGLAEAVAGSPTARAVDTAADLAALNALEIVRSSGLLTVAPANNPNCYSLPCPEDIARAQTENQRRADVLHSLIVETANAGL
jgi:hypothetical protein